MKKFVLLSFLICSGARAIPCDCEVQVYHPITASHQITSAPMNEYSLQSFDTLSRRSQFKCRKLCREEFEKDMPSDRLTALLATLSQRLIAERVVGFNCTGLTSFKYPVRVKARLGDLSLGNVAERLEVVTHEEACF